MSIGERGAEQEVILVRRRPPLAAVRPAATDRTLPRRRWRLGLEVVPLVVGVDLAALAVAVIAVDLGVISTALMAGILITLNIAGGQYQARLAPALLNELPSLVGRALVAGAFVAAFRLTIDYPAGDGPIRVSVLVIVLAVAGRAIVYPLVRRNRVLGHVAQPALIIGCGHVGNSLAETLLTHREYGLVPIGFVDDRPLVAPEDRVVPLLGGTDVLASVLAEHRVRAVIVAFSSQPETLVVDLLRTCDRNSCEIFLVPRLFELSATTGRDTELVWGIPLNRLRRAAFRTFGWRVKRLLDAAVAFVSLLLLSPLLLAIALAVRLDGGPGVIFRQERVGLDGHPFTILKFRTLTPASSGEQHTTWNIGSDPRLTRQGRLLRSTSLDELPQLWNVLRGDMSMVGPRPERPLFVAEFTRRFPRYMARHRVPAGLTGWSQVNGLRGDTDIYDRARFDNYYIENWSVWQDIKIMMLTLAQVVRASGR